VGVCLITGCAVARAGGELDNKRRCGDVDNDLDTRRAVGWTVREFAENMDDHG
jgi:hypothetical protein